MFNTLRLRALLPRRPRSRVASDRPATSPPPASFPGCVGRRFVLLVATSCLLVELAVMQFLLPRLFGDLSSSAAAVTDALVLSGFLAIVLWWGLVRPLRGSAVAEAEHARVVLAAVEAAAETVVVTDREGRIEFVNRAFETVTGYSKGEALGRNPRILRSGAQDEGFYDGMWTTILAGRVWRGRITNRRRDGSLYDAEATISPVLDASGRPVKFVSVQRDVSRETELERNLHHAARMEATGQLAAGVAHDLNNFLTLVIGNASLMETQLGDGDPRRDRVDQIRQAGEAAALLTSGLVAFGRRDAAPAQPQQVDAVVEGIRPLLQTCLGRRAALRADLDDGGARVRVGVLPLQQVLLNLTVNARDALPEGGEFRVRTGQATRPSTAGAPAAPCVVLEVADTGTGMEESVRARVFEPYFTTKGPERGTGLGLSTVRRIVEGAGGEIRVASAPGRGTTFTILLPVAV